MSATTVRNSDLSEAAAIANVATDLDVLVVPVLGVDRALTPTLSRTGS
jgi:hypothetical protein